MLTGSRVSHPVARLRYGWLIHWVPTCIAEGQVVEADVAIQWGRARGWRGMAACPWFAGRWR